MYHVRITCPVCGKTGKVRRTYIGRRVTCKRCRRTFATLVSPGGSGPAPGVPPQSPSRARLVGTTLVVALVLVVGLYVALGLVFAGTRHEDLSKREAATAGKPVEEPAPAPKGATAAEPPPAKRPPVADAPLSPPAEGTLGKGRETVALDAVGDARTALKLRLHTGPYTQLKKNTPNMAVWLRKLGLGQNWAEVEDVQGSFEDSTNTVSISFATRGLARVREGDCWEAPVVEGPDLELVAVQDNAATLSGALQTDGGLATLRIDVELPPGSQDVHLLRGPARLRFRMPAPAAPEGNNPTLDFALHAKPRLMTCLAKSYGNPKFAQLWAARAVLKNTGNRTLRDYRVRFRLGDFTPTWGPWECCKRVVPGQTVVDAYFPVFDLDRVARLNSSCQAMLEAEYEYRQADGQVVHKIEMARVTLLGRNEVIFSTLPDEEAVDFQDEFNNGPVILASFVTHEDPVIQQVAGWVSGQAGGVAASDTDLEAVKFMRALYAFLAANRIAYQTPPGGRIDGQFGQHVKYGRDVLRNRAGTCIDLAILYGSVCEAVGLKPVLFLIRGHCFPAVELPGGNLLAVETTGVGEMDFEQATKVARKRVLEIRAGLPHFEVNVRKLHDLGVHSLELPSLPPSALNDWGIERVQPRNTTTTAPRYVPRPEQAVPAAQRNLVGAWQATVVSNGLVCAVTMVLKPDGTFWARTESLGLVLLQLSGRYSYAGNVLQMRYSNGWYEKDTITWLSRDRFWCECVESNVPGAVGLAMPFTRMK